MNDPFSPGLLSRLTESPRKIVLLRASRIGDFLCATPSYRALRKALPDAEITMITLPMLQDLALTTFLGVPAQGKGIGFPLWPSDHEEAATLLEQVESPLIGLHPTARDATRRWALDRFGEVGYELRRRFGGTVVILGEEEDLATGNVLSKLVGERCL